MTVGERIRAIRKAKGLTQKELGERLGLSSQSVAQWENNLRKPKFETTLKIASALGIDVSVLAPSFEELLEDETQSIYLDAIKTRFLDLNPKGQKIVADAAIAFAESLLSDPEYSRRGASHDE